MKIIDRILEEVQRGLDSPFKREIQRLLGLVRLLGELYNYAAATSSLIFDLLYHLINFGHEVPPQGESVSPTLPLIN
jgi:regulator of nonsense transcripts 2